MRLYAIFGVNMPASDASVFTQVPWLTIGLSALPLLAELADTP